jgi:O-methyltransferase/aklanonic acid methyltransferase
MTNRSDMQAKEAMAGVFSRASARYDRVVTSLFDHLGSRLVEYVELEPGWQVLDVACGRGATVFSASEKTGPAGRITAIDLAPGMVEALHHDADERGVHNLEVRVADAEDIPYPGGSFDAVLCGFALFFFPNSHQALSEFGRVLVSGGRLGISTFAPAVSEGLAWFSELLRNALHLPDRAEETIQFDQPDQLSQALAEAGFTDIEVQEERFTISVPSAGDFWEWMWSIAIRGLLERLDEPTAESVRRATETHLNRELGPPPYHFTADALLTRTVKP